MTANSDEKVWTEESIRGLGPVTDVPTAASIFGISRSTAYELVQRDEFPVPVLRFGSRYRIPTAPIIAALRLPPADRADECHGTT
ncbi:helix-turn-helix transcriptional regulator [Actinoplanes sp. URMC 104]|uniref:helix-turn-helix transcriptional regulator n=1 Tax=Actinoplanes sp. URMC 104 TaxID=3423409 RepID=UPI003F193041